MFRADPDSACGQTVVSLFWAFFSSFFSEKGMSVYTAWTSLRDQRLFELSTLTSTIKVDSLLFLALKVCSYTNQKN